MQVELHETERRIVVRVEEEEALAALLDKARADMLVLRLATRVEEGASFELHLACGEQRLEVPARVKQVFRSGVDLFGTLLHVDLDALGAAAPDEPWVEVVDDEDDEAAAGGSGAGCEADEDEAPSLAGETLGTSVAFELQRMRADEKVRLATRANRAQRQILLRDRTPQVLLALLNNPWIENAEILEIAKNPKVAGSVLQRLAEDRRFGPIAQVQVAIARNPSTPWPVAQRLLPTLPTRELRELARSQHVRENVRKAALKLYLGKV